MRYLLVLFCLLISSAVSAQNAQIDSLKKVIATTKVDTVKGRTLCRLSRVFEMIGDIETAIKRSEDGLMLSEQIKDSSNIVLCLANLGELNINQDNYSKALGYFQKCLEVSEQIKDTTGIGICLNNFGRIHKYQGNYPKALEYQQKALRLYEKQKNKRGMGSNMINIGTIYFEQKNYPNALEYFQKALKMQEEVKNYVSVAGCYLNIGAVYEKQNELSKALEYLQKALNQFEQLKNQRLVAYCLSHIGDIYDTQKEYAKALDYYQKSLKLSKEINSPMGVSSVNANIANNYIKQGQPNLARNHSRIALQTAAEIKNVDYMRLGAEVSYKADSALGDWKSAFEYHKLYKQYSDSLNNEDKAKEFGRVESKYQFEKEAEEAKRKQEELAKIEAEKTERRNNLQYLTIFAGIIGLFAGLVFIGKFKIPTRVMDVAVFAGLLILFEFLLILFDPWLDNFSGGIPFYKLGFNTVVAFAFAPLHGFLESKLKKRLVKAEKV